MLDVFTSSVRHSGTTLPLRVLPPSFSLSSHAFMKGCVLKIEFAAGHFSKFDESVCACVCLC